jgi:hypothetical protein
MHLTVSSLHASPYWVDALATVTYLINRLPTKTLGPSTPYFALHATHPSYHELRVFGCACYPNLTATTPHKLAPRSTLCVFFGYSLDHKGYRCLDLTSNRVIMSRHVTFDESHFPFSHHRSSSPPGELDFLTNIEPPPAPIHSTGTPTTSGRASSLPMAAAPLQVEPPDEPPPLQCSHIALVISRRHPGLHQAFPHFWLHLQRPRYLLPLHRR